MSFKNWLLSENYSPEAIAFIKDCASRGITPWRLVVGFPDKFAHLFPGASLDDIRGLYRQLGQNFQETPQEAHIRNIICIQKPVEPQMAGQRTIYSFLEYILSKNVSLQQFAQVCPQTTKLLQDNGISLEDAINVVKMK
jgi:hypothetical protein